MLSTVNRNVSSSSANVGINEKTRETWDLLETSYRNIPQSWDQEVHTPKHPVSLKENENLFPTLPMFNRRDSFAKFDLDTLLFAFYYKQGSYQ